MKEDTEFTESELAQALHDSAAECHPTQLHLDRLRSELLSLTVSLTETDGSAAVAGVHDHHPRSAGICRSAEAGVMQSRRATWRQLAGVAALILIGIVATQPFSGTASADLASSLKVMRAEYWIHASTTIEHHGNTVKSEAWYSPQLRISAFRSHHSQHLVDYNTGIQSSHAADTNVVYRWRADPNMENFGSAFVKAILTDGDLTTIFPDHHVSHLNKSVVDRNGQSCIEYRFRLEWNGDRKMQVDTVVLADRASQRLLSWDEVHSGAKRVLTQFSYPASGPQDIYALGASRDAQVIDRVASSDVVDLAQEFKHDVLNFDDYQALVIDRWLPSGSSKDDLDMSSPSPAQRVIVRRVVRNGKEFRVDLVEFAGNKVSPPSASWPEQIDVAWWKTQTDNLSYHPLAICDGLTCTLYPTDEQGLLGRFFGTDFPIVKSLQRIPVAVLNNGRGQTAIPVWPELWPEYACRPLIMPTDPNASFEVDPAGTDGPSDTIRLQVLSPDSPFASARTSYWLALQQDHCLVKSLTLRPTFSKHSGRPVEEAVEARFSHFERSPSDIVFATRRLTVEPTNSLLRQTDFVVDFLHVE